jgi:hypothetical protein
MIDAVSTDGHDDMNIAMRACMHREIGERPQHRALHRVYKEEEK